MITLREHYRRKLITHIQKNYPKDEGVQNAQPAAPPPPPQPPAASLPLPPSMPPPVVQLPKASSAQNASLSLPLASPDVTQQMRSHKPSMSELAEASQPVRAKAGAKAAAARKPTGPRTSTAQQQPGLADHQMKAFQTLPPPAPPSLGRQQSDGSLFVGMLAGDALVTNINGGGGLG